MLKRWMKLVTEARGLPEISIDLQHAKTADNDAFFGQAVCRYHVDATRRHRKFPLVRQSEYGFCVCILPATFEEYFRSVEGAARRNYKKSLRLGYRFERLDYNAHLDDVAAILRSSAIRQGRPMPADLLTQEATAINNPPTRSNTHDYPYYGVFRDDRLYAYGSCLVAGDLCSIQTIYGHADHQGDGVVPMLIIGTAQRVMNDYPHVRYYAYGNYFGATETMQRFKRKFGFMPRRARWILG